MKHEHHITSLSTLIKTIVSLIILTILTVAASQVDLGSHAINTLVAIVIASMKAYLVASYFMGLKYDSRTHALVLLTSVGFVVLLYLFTAIDVFSRVNVESTL